MHLILILADESGLRDALGEAHRRYTRMVNVREGWKGHLSQQRCHSLVMDERNQLAAARYVERRPVRAHLCTRAQDWAWSSAAAHFAGRDSALVAVQPLLDSVPDWEAFIGEGEDESFNDRPRGHTSTGRPLGSDAFVESLGRRLARALKGKKPGPSHKSRIATPATCSARESGIA